MNKLIHGIEPAEIADELELFMVNDWETYDGHLMPLYKRYERRFRDGTFDRQRAIVGMMKACLFASEKCHRDTDLPGRWNFYFPKRVREITAASLVDRLISELAAGNSYL